MNQLLKMPGQGVDFHMHTTASDGAWTPETLVENVAQAGIKVMTVSDHDTIGSVQAVQKLAQAHGIQFVPGVEITIKWREAMYHLLVFNFDPENIGLNALLADTQAQMHAKHATIIEGLQKRGYKLNILDSFRRPDGHHLSVDIPRALVKGGEVASFDRAFSMCLELGLQKVCSQPADLAIKTAIAAGGIPVIAHPGRQEYSFSAATTQVLRELLDVGLMGLEAYHPSHAPETVELYLDFAHKHKMVVSAGNDSHSEARKPTPWNPELVRDLLERFALDVPQANAA